VTATYQRFDGEIYGFGTESGDRFVVGRWLVSPQGEFADVMHESPTGHRTLHAPTDAVADLVRSTYEFDEVRVGPVRVERSSHRLTVQVDGLAIVVEVGGRTWLGRVLRLVPGRVARSRRWATVIDPVARLVLDGVRTRGSAGNGRTEWYGATDQHRLTRVEVDAAGRGLGDLADVWPPVRFGFSSTPRLPSVTSVTTTIRM
jgi:hypothetical protein